MNDSKISIDVSIPSTGVIYNGYVPDYITATNYGAFYTNYTLPYKDMKIHFTLEELIEATKEMFPERYI